MMKKKERQDYSVLQFEKLGVILPPVDSMHAKFNTAAWREGDTVHLLYRWGQLKEPSPGFLPKYARNYISYARITPEGKLLRDEGTPVFQITHPWESKGIEDPRIMELDGKIYITYTAWDGIQARVALAWAEPGFRAFHKIGIIPAGRFDKDAYFFPRRIGGKIAYVHRFEPNIQIDFFDSVEEMLDPGFWAGYDPDRDGSVVLTAEQPWENGKVGGSVPPIWTEHGWLLLYHGVGADREPFCYRVGAALVDLENPRKVIARLPYPIMEPTEDYEIRGDVNNVVFPCGTYEDGGYLYMVYGGADKVTALARCRTEELIGELLKYRRD